MYRDTLKILLKNRGLFFFIILMLVNFIMSCVMPALNGYFLDSLISNHGYAQVFVLAALVALLGIFAAILSYALQVLVAKLVLEVSTHILNRASIAFEKKDLREIEETDPAYVSQLISSDSNNVASFVVNNFLTFGLNIILLVIIAGVLYRINLLFLFVCAVSLFMYCILYKVLRKPFYNASLSNKEGLSRLFSTVNGELSQAFEIKCNELYLQSDQVIQSAVCRYMPVFMKANRISNLFTSCDGLISSICKGVILLISGIEIISGRMTVGEFTMINAYCSMAFSCFKYLLNYLKSYQDALVSYNRLNETARSDEPSVSKMPLSHQVELPQKIHTILLKDLKFGYEGSPLFAIPHFVMKQGGSYAIVGDNGVGKTTFVKVILGLYHADGILWINGCNCADVDLSSMRRERFAVCAQNAYVPDESVEEYLRRFAPDGSLDHLDCLEKHLPLICADIKRLHHDNCRSLSGGEFRKVRVLSALHKNSDVVIMDEPTNDLDEPSKEELVHYISANPNGQMFIIVSHDLKLISACKVRLNLADGLSSESNE